MGDAPPVSNADAEPGIRDDEVGEVEEKLGDNPSAPGDRGLPENSEAEALPEEAVGYREEVDGGEAEAPGDGLPAGIGEASVVASEEEEAGEEMGGEGEEESDEEEVVAENPWDELERGDAEPEAAEGVAGGEGEANVEDRSEEEDTGEFDSRWGSGEAAAAAGEEEKVESIIGEEGLRAVFKGEGEVAAGVAPEEAAVGDDGDVARPRVFENPGDDGPNG